MRKMKRMVCAAGTAFMVCCMAGSTVSAAPVSDIEQQKSAAESEAESLQKQLMELLSQVDEMEAKLIATGEEITQTEADLAAAREKAQEQYDAMKIRIKYMYEDGESDMWAALLTAKDFTDFINKAEYASTVHSYDRKQLDELKQTVSTIEELKTTLEKEQADLEKQQEDYTAKQEDVNAQLEEKRAQIAGFDEQLLAAVEAAAGQAQEEEEAEDEGASSGTVSGGNSGTISGGNSGTASGGSGSNSSGSGSSGTSSGNTSVAQTIVSAAYSQLGVPYKYGGSTPGVGLDCSGLVQYCHAVAGITLPRTSGAQGGCGIAVSSPQPGDIVCYVGHVGIYIGNGQMIHAPQTGDVVKIASVYGSPWYRRCW